MANRTQVPDGWRLVRLERIAEERRVRANSDPQADVFSVTKHDGLVRSLEYFDRQVFSRDTSNYKVVRRGDLAYATIHLDEGSLGILRDADTALISPMYTVFSVDKTQVDPNFLFALMKLPQMVARYGRIGEGTVHRRKSISFKRLGRLAFEIPPVDEQRRIMDVLSGIDEAIERTEAVISATERLRDALLHELLTRGVPGWHTRWRNVFGIGTIPVDWKETRLGEICEPPKYGAVSPARPFDPTLSRYVRITDLTEEGSLRADDLRSADPSVVVGYELRDGDLLFARSGATVGKTYLYRSEDGPCVFAGYLIRFRVKPSIALARFAEIYTRSSTYRRWVKSMLRAGAQPNINASEYSSLPIPLPPLAEQRRITTVLGGVDEALTRARSEKDVLETLKQASSDALLTGRVTIEQGNPSNV